MNLIPHVISGVNHPLVSQVYVKEGLRLRNKTEHVLVIRTNIERDIEVADDDMLMSLFAALPAIKDKARSQTGNSIERLEIRYN